MTKEMKSLLKQVAVAAAVGAVVGALRATGHALPALPVHMVFSLGMKLSLALWVLFSIYWALAARDSAPTSSAESGWSRRLHLLLVNAALLLLVLPVPGLTWRFLPAHPFLMADGLATQASFILFAVWARRHLGSNWSGEVRIAAGHQLVRSGPYHFLRHPIYTAVLGMYCGTALVSGEIHALLALLLVTLAYWRKIRLEERALAETFGADHEAYRRHTWALIPGVY